MYADCSGEPGPPLEQWWIRLKQALENWIGKKKRIKDKYWKYPKNRLNPFLLLLML